MVQAGLSTSLKNERRLGANDHVIYMSLFGFNLGLSSPFMGSLWAEIYGVKSIGTAKAILHAVSVFASALSPVIFGYAIDLGFGLIAIFLISSIMYFAV